MIISAHSFFDRVSMFRIDSWLLIVLIFTGLTGCERPDAQLVNLSNQALTLRLGATAEGEPVIASAWWLDQAEPIWTDPTAITPGNWRLGEDSLHVTASAEGAQGSTFHVALAKNQTLIKVWRTWKSDITRQIDTMTVWRGNWQVSALPTIETREALTYRPIQFSGTLGEKVTWGADGYSSQEGESLGQLPFWHTDAGSQHIYTGLSWSGGWRAEIAAEGNRLSWKVFLPPHETELTLKAGEEIAGPEWFIVPVHPSEAPEARKAYHQQWRDYHQARYPQPEGRYPLLFNHWYAVNRDLSEAYLRNQVAALQDYGFDVFVVDDGWYESVGNWHSDPTKFGEGDMEQALGDVDQAAILTGLWSCPWLADSSFSGKPGWIFEEPPYFNRHMQAYSLDPVSMNFDSFMVDHMGSLIDQFGVDWWKYDQELFGEGSRFGKYRKMKALENGLLAVRMAFPELIMENCLSGGRMLNAFTDGITQVHWLRDGGQNDPSHAETNVEEVLGALTFFPPYKAQRWTNRLNEITDENRFRDYCRSCMMGVWGMSLDLGKLSPDQERWLKEEIHLYREVNSCKSTLRYSIHQDSSLSPWRGIWFDGEDGIAGVFVNWGEKKSTLPEPPAAWLSEQMEVHINGKAVGSLINWETMFNSSSSSMVVSLKPTTGE